MQQQILLRLLGRAIFSEGAYGDFKGSSCNKFKLLTKQVCNWGWFPGRQVKYCHRYLSHLVGSSMEEAQTFATRHTAVVRCMDGKETMNISFHFKGKDYNLLRGQTESLGKTFARISQNLQKLADKANKRRAKKVKGRTQPQENEINILVSIPECSILHTGNKLMPLETINREAWVDGSILRIGELATYTIKVNVPAITNLKLPSYLMVGCPVFPVLESEFSDSKFCKFSWYTESSSPNAACSPYEETGKIDIKRNWILISEEKVFTPTLKEIGKFLLLKCTPGNGEKEGEPLEVISRSTVAQSPDNIPFVVRHRETKERSVGPVFRIVCYNLLADLYANSEFSHHFLFPHCPPEYLNADYRQQMLLKEIIGYHGDIICLQEVDKGYFERNLQPTLESIGLQGILCCKKGGIAEGEAMFFQENRYKLTSQHDICLSNKLLEDAANKELLAVISKAQSFFDNISSKSTVAQVVVLDDEWNPGKRLVVANTHLYFHPNANNVRMVQTVLVLRHIQQLLDQYQQEIPDYSISVLFMGDLNSTPKSGAYQLIASGHVPANSSHWYTGGLEEFCGGMVLTHQMKLKSVCPNIPYTNYVPAFMETIDHIFYSEDTIGVERVIPMPSHEEVTRFSALPNKVFPSDHLPLVCDLKWL